MPRRLETTISDALWEALHERSRSTGRSIRDLVQQALADGLDLDHHSLFQVSTSGALVEGLYQGAVTVGDLRRHGDLGLGTFEELDGEMVMLDGRCYRVGSDQSVTEVPDDRLTPFATVVAFAADAVHEIDDVASWDDLTSRLDAMRRSDNDFVAWRIRGTVTAMKLRAACRHESGTPLVEAIADQAVFGVADTACTLVGFWSPAYAPSVAIPGYHLHALTDDLAHGGHVFDLEAPRLSVEVHRVNDLRLALPETEAFLRADLSADSGAAMHEAERPAD